MTNLMAIDPGFEVFSFCQENEIECTWDLNREHNQEWTEVLFLGKLVFQIDKACTKEQFIQLVFELKDNFLWQEQDVPGPDFWFSVTENEDLFKEFFNFYCTTFLKHKTA